MRMMTIRGIRSLPFALMALAVVLLAGCIGGESAQPGLQPNTSEPLNRLIPPYYGPTTLEERILSADVIARVRLRSMEAAASRRDLDEVYYEPGIKFTFDVTEYLKGTGNGELVTVVSDYRHPRLDNEQAAINVAQDLVQYRDTRWDGREALVFFVNDPRSGLTNHPYEFVTGGGSLENTQAYMIDSRYNKSWLPAAASGGAAGASGSEARFLLDAPNEEVASGVSGASGAGSSAAPTIALSRVKSLVADMDQLLETSQDSEDYTEEDYRQCLVGKHRIKRELQWKEDNNISVNYRFEYELQSGSSAGTVLDSGAVSGATPGKPDRHWLEGRDQKLFKVEFDDHVISFVSARPIPGGEYQFFHNTESWIQSLCDSYPDELRNSRTWIVNVTTPTGTVHEAFFDPVTIGVAVGADTTNGVLKPKSFSLGEGTTTASLEKTTWESGRVIMELEPSVPLARHHADFITLDGSVSLRLDFDDASEVVDGAKRTLAWNVCTQPWESGNLLMLRISKSEEDLAGATNDGVCPPPAPQNLTASFTDDSVTLIWDVTDDPTVTGYLILRRVAKQHTFVKLDVNQGAATTYVDTTDIEPGTKYIYRVHAVNTVGLSEVSRVTATPAATPSIPVTDVAGTSPPSPQGLTASSTHESVTLMWDAGDDPPTGYLILRRVAKQDTFVKFEVTNGTATTYVDTTDIEPGTKYIYRVHAVNAVGLSEVSRVTVTTRTVP